MTAQFGAFTIRRLTGQDASGYKQLRIESLENHPTSFAANIDDERAMSDDDVVDRLARSVVFGAFDDQGLTGIVGWYAMSGVRFAHRGSLWGMYVQPRSRGRGLGMELVRRTLADARGKVDQLHLIVESNNSDARRLYERAGCVTYSIEPRSMKVGDTYYDDVLMAHALD